MGQDDSQVDLILTRTELDRCQRIRVGAGYACYFTTRTPGKESPNEDSLALVGMDSTRGVIALADGFGGQPAGDQASELAVRAVVSSVHDAVQNGADLRDAIMDSFEQANDAVLALGVGAASTLAVVEIDGDSVRAYHAGDSEVLMVGQCGKVKLTTMSHSPVGYGLEAGWISEEDALHHEERHLVSNMIGSSQMRIDVGPPVTMRPRDRLLIATDGLFDNAGVPEIVEIIRKGPLESAVTNLVRSCHRKMTEPRDGEPSKPDDLSLVLYHRQRYSGPQAGGAL
ncbi:MAG: protein phosphatase 2C domain-containing protein [Phycisphaerales bacterium]|nr:MAG: protein phosphatase 2C domain-containing protein [Phycisphaerales bacterium]